MLLYKPHEIPHPIRDELGRVERGAIEFNNVRMARALPHDSLVIEPLYGTLRSGNPEKMIKIQYLVSLWVIFGINPHPFNANL